jgi:hypothetical protein
VLELFWKYPRVPSFYKYRLFLYNVNLFSLLFPERSKKVTIKRWAIQAVDAESTLLKEICMARNDRIHKEEDGQSMADQHIRDWVTDYYANKDIQVTAEERDRLFEAPLDERLQDKCQFISIVATNCLTHSE